MKKKKEEEEETEEKEKHIRRDLDRPSRVSSFSRRHCRRFFSSIFFLEN